MKDPNAVLLISKGCPETAADLPAFLDGMVLRDLLSNDKRVEFEERFRGIGGACPHNQQVKDQVQCLERLLHARGRFLPVRAGFMYSFPSVFDSVKAFAASGNARILAISLVPFPEPRTQALLEQSLSRAIADVNLERREPVEAVWSRPFATRPGFIQATASCIQEALQAFDPPAGPVGTELVFVAPVPENGGARLQESCKLAASRAGFHSHGLAGPGASLLGSLEECSREGKKRVLLSPLGYPVDSFGMLWELDVEARKKAVELGLTLVRASSVGTHPSFIATLSSLVEEALP